MLKVIELFSGIGSQTQALKDEQIEHEVIAISEIDKYAITSYEAMHGVANNLGNILDIKELPSCDLLTYSFPCQDISMAGRQAGISVGTRSGLLYEVERLLLVAKAQGLLPKYLLLENVKNLVGKMYREDFKLFLQKLSELGYTNYWQVLNAKDYNLPQSRERVFVVSILDSKEPYIFPTAVPLTTKLKDILEIEPDSKYSLTTEQIGYITNSNYAQNTRRIQKKDYCDTLCARDYKDPKCVEVGGRIRKITPKESFRLTGFKDESFERARTALNDTYYNGKDRSGSQLYKQAGNSIAVPVLRGIFRNLFCKGEI